MNLNRIIPVTILVSVIVAMTSEALGQAYCALRDPVSSIYDAYPEADTYRSIVRTIDEDVRKQVAARLPFTIHFNELGRHTLYVPTKDTRPLGLVHVRTEQGSWGLVEVAWSFDNSLRINDFSFQRCRSSARRELEAEAFKRQIIGKRFDDLRMLLNKDGQSLRMGVMSVSEEASKLAATVVRSALKTIAVTELAWARDLETLKILDHAFAAFPSGRTINRITEPYSAEAISEIETYFETKHGSTIDRKSIIALRVLDEGGQTVGYVYRTRWSSMGKAMEIWWNVTPELAIADIIPEGDWPDPEIATSFKDVKGLSIDELHQCSTAAQLVGAELLVISKANE